MADKLVVLMGQKLAVTMVEKMVDSKAEQLVDYWAAKSVALKVVKWAKPMVDCLAELLAAPTVLQLA